MNHSSPLLQPLTHSPVSSESPLAPPPKQHHPSAKPRRVRRNVTPSDPWSDGSPREPSGSSPLTSPAMMSPEEALLTSRDLTFATLDADGIELVEKKTPPALAPAKPGAVTFSSPAVDEAAMRRVTLPQGGPTRRPHLLSDLGLTDSPSRPHAQSLSSTADGGDESKERLSRKDTFSEAGPTNTTVIAALEGRRRSRSIMREMGVSKSSILRASGMDMVKLRQAFATLDVQGDGGLELFEFRNFWKAVFPQRQMDPNTWKNTERMFNEMDTDSSGVISFEEIIEYLEQNRREELERSKRPETMKEWVWKLCGPDSSSEWTRKGDNCLKLGITLFRFTSQIMVIASVAVLMVDSLPSMYSDHPLGNSTTFIIESVCVVFFTFEFIGWLYSYPSRPEASKENDEFDTEEEEEEEEEEEAKEAKREGEGRKEKKWKFLLLEVTTWIDFLSILPYYLSILAYLASVDLTGASPLAAVRMTRTMRLLRILRIMRIGRGRFARAPELGSALNKSIASLNFLFLLIVIAMTLSSSFIFYAEMEDAEFNTTVEKWIRNPDSTYDDRGLPTSFQSIPDAMWWGIVTLTTVGYGDKYPFTAWGKVIASITMLAGLIVVGVPITILTSTFQAMEEERAEKEQRRECCRDFYRGIKHWLHAGGNIKVSNPLKQPIPGSPSSPPKQHTAADSSTVLAAVHTLQTTITALSENLTQRLAHTEAQLSSLSNRVAAIEGRALPPPNPTL